MDDGARRRARIEAARLYLVVDTAAAPTVVPPALDGGVDVVQLRDKDVTDDRLVECARALRAECDSRGALLIVNDRPDLALAATADGVHVGQDDEPPAAVRAAVGPELLIGVSTHSREQIAAAERSEADYLGVGPVFATPTKPTAAPAGTELVRHAAAHARKPFFAIGGIDPHRAALVAEAGARRIAVVRAIRDAPDPRASARELRAALEREVVGGAAQ